MKHNVRPQSDPRSTAATVLNRLDEQRVPLDQVLDALEDEGRFSAMPPRDRSLFNALVYGVLRWRGRLDWMIGRFSKTPLHRIDPRVLNMLRLGAFQIALLDRIPVSAAVNTSVNLVKTVAPPWVVRFTNAVLRNLAGGYRALPLPDPQKDPVRALAVEASFPEWLIRRWLNRFGVDETAAFCHAVNTIPPITVRVNTLRTDRNRLTASLLNHAVRVEPSVYAPDGVDLWRLKQPLQTLNAFRDGWFQVQDAAAQLVSLFVDPKPGESILDACAGLGGKTGHLAQLMCDRGAVTAMDRDAGKLDRLAAEMKRLGIACVRPLVHHWPEDPLIEGGFDRVLLDAPCSGLGVLRRNPDAKWTTAESDLTRHQERQGRILSRTAACVRPGGLLVYAVCSTEPEETEAVLGRFLEEHPNFSIDTTPGKLTDAACRTLTPAGHLRTLPHRHGMDGFFAARLKRSE